MAERFDELTKILGSSVSRRQAFRLFAGGFASRYLAPLTGGALGFFLPERALAVAGSPAIACGAQFCVGPGGIGGGLCGINCGTSFVCCPASFSPCGPCNCCATAEERCCLGTYCCPVNLQCCPTGGGCCQPPGFRLAAYYTYPRNKVEIEVREYTGVGLSRIGIAQAVNAQVDIPSFAPGATYVLVTATRIDQSKPAQLVLQACSTACQDQCCENGDPVVTQLHIAEGRNRVTESFAEIPHNERYATFQNGKKGLNRVHVVVNGQRIANVVLQSEEVRTIDIASALKASSQNSVTVIGRGNAGGSALLVISDVPGASGDDKAGNSLPYIVWEEGAGEPGANLRWGM
jgi:hypothetical protein